MKDPRIQLYGTIVYGEILNDWERVSILVQRYY